MAGGVGRKSPIRFLALIGFHRMRSLFFIWMPCLVTQGSFLWGGDAQWQTHKLESQHQRHATTIHVRTPDDLEAHKKYRVLYLLPVEGGDGQRWGNAMAEADKLNLANKHKLICIYPTFADLPWYANHPTNKSLQQETYFLEDVIPLVEREYPALANSDGRLLVGFSKSGWGAWSLLLRHPEKFAAAAAWDAPLMENKPKYGMAPIVGSDGNFRQYHIQTLLRTRGKELGEESRLVLTGYDNFRPQIQRTHAMLEELGVSHIYRDGPQRKHHWESGWLGEAVTLLVEATQQD